MISLKGVNHSFAAKIVLKDLNLEVQSSNIHSLIGLTGAGKTLLLKILANLIPLQSGTIENTCRKTSFVFQQNPFLPWLSMEENLRLSTGHATSFIKEHLKEFHLEEYIDLYPKQLSGGTIQKFSLFRAFIINADLILLDEPFSHLDIIQKEDLYQFMLKLWSIQKPTIILVTHDIDEALMLSHSVSLLSKKTHAIVETIHLKKQDSHELLHLLNYRENEELKYHYSSVYNFLKVDLQ